MHIIDLIEIYIKKNINYNHSIEYFFWNRYPLFIFSLLKQNFSLLLFRFPSPDTQDVDLDNILKELSALETQYDEAIKSEHSDTGELSILKVKKYLKFS